MIASAIGFAAVFVLVLLRLPIAFAMGLVGMIGLVYETSYRASISMVSRLIIDTSQDYGLSVIPLFVLMGEFATRALGVGLAVWISLGALAGALWQREMREAGIPQAA